jgi:hypothetical protein
MNIDSYKLNNLFHILIVFPFLYYVYKYRNSLSDNICNILLVTAIIGFIYHLYLYTKGLHPWVNLIHLLLVFPLLYYIGKNCKKTTRKYFEMLLLLAFASLGFHLHELLSY